MERPLEVLVMAPPNGFDESGQVDEFSRHSLAKALAIYRRQKANGRKVAFGITRCIVRSPRGQVLWRAWYNLVREQGVPWHDVLVSQTPVLNLLTDGLAVCEFARQYPGVQVQVVIFAGQPLLGYVRSAYLAVARHMARLDLDLCVLRSEGGLVPGWRSQAVYWLAWGITGLAGKIRPLFLAWYRLRQWTDAGRVRRFTRTVKPR